MTRSAGSYKRLKDKSNTASPHAPVNGVVSVIDMELNPMANAAEA